MSIETGKAELSTRCRLLLQQCVRAELRVDEDNLLAIDRGVVIYVSFLKGATEEVARQAARVALQLKICETDTGKFVSASELPADILLIPQACLGGKRKSTNMQYHQLVEKNLGLQLFEVTRPVLELLLEFTVNVKSFSSMRRWAHTRTS